MTQVLQESIEQERSYNRSLLLVISLAMLAIVIIVGLGMGIVVYNSVNNSPKLQCVYSFSKTGVNDIHHLLNNDKNPKDYPEVNCNG